LIVTLNKLGDTIFTLPALRKIINNNSEKIAIACYPESIPIYEIEFKNVEFCIINRKSFYFGKRVAKADLRKRLQLLEPNTVIDLTCTMVSASLIFNLKCELIIGINGKLFKSIYDKFIDIRKTPKLQDIYLDAIFPLVQTRNEPEIKQTEKKTKSEGKIIVHPLAAWREKEWGLRNYYKLAKKISNTYSVSMLVPNHQISIDVLQEISSSDIEIIQTSSTDELLHNLRECSLFIGNDSGPVNIANYFGKPTLSIYGATNPEYTATYLDHQLYIQKKFFCSAGENEKYCLVGADVFSCSGVQCMSLITVNEVYNLAKLLMEKYCARKV
jgi:ADP-heptose:LPS heptosyltransferase